MISILKKIFGSSVDEEGGTAGDELWIMIKESEFFRSDEHLEVGDKISEIIEGSGLGELDGHSSGSYQFEINFFDITNYAEAKRVIDDYFKSNHPEIEYTISKEYETTYEAH